MVLCIFGLQQRLDAGEIVPVRGPAVLQALLRVRELHALGFPVAEPPSARLTINQGANHSF